VRPPSPRNPPARLVTWEKVMVTGHRPQHLTAQQRDFAERELARLAVKLRDERGTRVAISGLALGADQWWAHYALQHGLDVWSYIPFPEQPDRWRPEDVVRWRALRSQSTRVWEGPVGYSVQKLHARNDHMITDADAAIAVWDPRITRGGTASCVAKILGRRIPLIHVDLERLITIIR
jgi:uncharacterized phage-like protein YoqJ